MADVLSSKIVLIDEYTKKAKKVSTSAKAVNNELEKTKKSGEKATDGMKKVSTEAVVTSKKLNKTVKAIKNLGRKLKTRFKLKINTDSLDRARKKINSVGSGFKKIAKFGLMGAGAVAGVGGFAGKKLFDSGSMLEQQKISMTHFLGGDKAKSDKYLQSLRTNANATPFETGEVIAAGTRAVQIADGDTKKSMEFVKLAEDMAALNPGKTISDAMEALADAKEIISHIGVRIINYLWKFRPYYVIIN